MKGTDMTARKGGTDPEPGPMSNQPRVGAQLRQLAKVAAARDTGIPVAKIGRGKHPVATAKKGAPKKGNKSNA